MPSDDGTRPKTHWQDNYSRFKGPDSFPDFILTLSLFSKLQKFVQKLICKGDKGDRKFRWKVLVFWIFMISSSLTLFVVMVVNGGGTDILKSGIHCKVKLQNLRSKRCFLANASRLCWLNQFLDRRCVGNGQCRLGTLGLSKRLCQPNSERGHRNWCRVLQQ